MQKNIEVKKQLTMWIQGFFMEDAGLLLNTVVVKKMAQYLMDRGVSVSFSSVLKNGDKK